MPHSFKYSLDQIKLLIESLPPTFPETEKEAMKREYEKVAADPHISQQEITDMIFRFGLQSWPYRKAFERIWEDNFISKMKSCVRQNLDSRYHAKYEYWLKFQEDTLSRQRLAHEEFTTHRDAFHPVLQSDETLAIREAEFSCKKKLLDEAAAGIGGEFSKIHEAYVEDFRALKERMLSRVEKLQKIAEKKPRIADEAKQTIVEWKESFSVLSKDLTLEEMDEVLEGYEPP